jgi:ABC-type dipeptide/oligopeptide/nickel transport system permease component
MIQRSDIEAKARQIEDALNETKDAAQNTAVLAGVAVIIAILIAFLMGRKKGKAGKAIVEVYRMK